MIKIWEYRQMDGHDIVDIIICWLIIWFVHLLYYFLKNKAKKAVPTPSNSDKLTLRICVIKWSAYQIPSVIVLFVILAFKV
jgi:glycopeptide antibiotics resistance protein